jgi:hypothetical protein
MLNVLKKGRFVSTKVGMCSKNAFYEQENLAIIFCATRKGLPGWMETLSGG